MKRAVVALAASALTLALAAGCQRREEAAEAPAATPVGAEVTEAEQAAPLTYSRETAYAEVTLTLPEAIAAYPDLHAAIYGEEVRTLRAFLEGAQSDHTEFTGEMELPPYEQAIEYAPAGETPRLFSLSETTYEYTGGAHPNSAYGAVLWDRSADRRIAPATLFRRGADMAALDRALCDAINAARSDLIGEASSLTMTETDGWSCPRAIETPFVLAPSTTTGRAGGLEFLIGPYIVGPYAEGSYQIVVPQTAFRSLLDPAFTGEFAGAPRRVGDVTPREPVTQAR